MTNQKPASNEPPADGPTVPWSDPLIQQQMRWRDGDIVVSVPPKSGTTWTMNIVHQLREGGDVAFQDIYIDVPWIELLSSPAVTRESVIAQLDAMPSERRRAFKTHSAPDDLPFHHADEGPDVQYVVVARNPDEVVASMYPFIGSHSRAWFEAWRMDKDEFVPPNFDIYFEHMATELLKATVFGFIESWWSLRNEPNVLLMHFTDMKADHEGSVRRIAEFLRFAPTESQWPTVLECTSFKWMKAHEDRFELRGVTDPHVLDPGSMVRKGRSGAAHEDGVTAEIAAETARIGREIMTDTNAFEWLYYGGQV